MEKTPAGGVEGPRAGPAISRGGGRRRRPVLRTSWRIDGHSGAASAAGGRAAEPAAAAARTTRAARAARRRGIGAQRTPRRPARRLCPAVAKVYDEITDHLRDWIAPPGDVLRGHRTARAGTATSTSRPRARSARSRVLAAAPVAYLDIARQRRGDDRPPARERPHLRDVLRLRGAAADRPPPRPRRGRAPGDPRFEGLLARGGFAEPRSRRRGARSSSSTSRASATRAATACR